MMIKAKIKKLDLHDDAKAFVKEHIEINDVEIIDVNMEHSLEIFNLPEIHRDPFDRMLIAQARVEQMTIITSDSSVNQYDVSTIW